ncbi:MAG: hypothetical protein EOO11_16720, partial [Chitinophagaceae bacterium]
MSKLPPYEERDRQWDDMPLPDVDAAWQQMNALLDKEPRKRRLLPPFLGSCAGIGLLAAALLGGGWWLLHNRGNGDYPATPVAATAPGTGGNGQVNGQRPGLSPAPTDGTEDNNATATPPAPANPATPATTAAPSARATGTPSAAPSGTATTGSTPNTTGAGSTIATNPTPAPPSPGAPASVSNSNRTGSAATRLATSTGSRNERRHSGKRLHRAAATTAGMVTGPGTGRPKQGSGNPKLDVAGSTTSTSAQPDATGTSRQTGAPNPQNLSSS